MTTAPFEIRGNRAVLLVVDLQNDFVREGAPQEVPDARASLPLVSSLVDTCRRSGVPVMFTRYTAGPHATYHSWFSPQCAPPTKSCWPGTTRQYQDRDEPLDGHDIVDELSPEHGEVIVDKYGYGAFDNTVLEDALRAAAASQVWIVGTVTQICVEETVRGGFRRGFELVVAADAVSSFDDELHRATLKNLGQKFAVVTTSGALITAAQGRAV